MVYDNGEQHLEEINHVSVLESIDEVFDGITSLMTLNSVMYGSTVTALLAGLPIEGDLDIAVSSQEYMMMTQNLASCVKWIQIEGKNVAERKHTHKRPYRSTPSPSSAPMVVHASPSSPFSSSDKKESIYSKVKHMPLSNVVAFQTVNGARVQIMESKAMTGDMLEDALKVVRRVDFVFCGIAIDRYGRVLEVMPHAYNDCLQRVIRIRDYQPEFDTGQLKQRFYKYIKRGWNLGISIDQAMLNLNKAKRKYYEQQAAKKGKKRPKPKPISGFRLVNKGSTVLIQARKELLGLIDSVSAVRDAVRHMAIPYGIDLDYTSKNPAHLELWSKRKKLTTSSAQAIIAASDRHLRKNFNVGPDKLYVMEKTLRLRSMYKDQ